MDGEEDVDVESEFTEAEGFKLETLEDERQEMSPHPWVIDQVWSMDQCTDEKSKAVIGKMILEEQQYLSGTYRGSPDLVSDSVLFGKEKLDSKKPTRFWTEEEKNLIIRGLEIFGKQWKKIAEIVPNRTYEQVRQYGMNFLRKQKANNDVENDAKQDDCAMKNAENLDDMLKAIQTGKPTVPVIKKGKHLQTTTVLKGKKSKGRGKSVNTEKSANLIAEAPVVRITSTDNSDSEEIDIDIEEDEPQENLTEPYNPLDQKTLSVNYTGSYSNTEMLQEGDSVVNDTSHFSHYSQLKTDSKTSEVDGIPVANSHQGFKFESPTYNSSISFDSSELTEEIQKDVEENVECDLQPLEMENERDSGEKNCPTSDVSIEKEFQDQENFEEDSLNEYPIQGSDGKVFYLVNPTESCTIDRKEISDQEKLIFVEFFDGRPGIKDPDKYLDIRNRIMGIWETTKPNYMNKTAMRQSLRKVKCDVNLMGKIHAFLEQIGAINFGCDQVQYKKGRKRSKSLKGGGESDYQLKTKYSRDELNKRRRKVRDIYGTWRDEKEIEGRTIDHETNVVSESVEVAKIRKPKKTGNAGYDPFKLIPCQEFGKTFPEPFKVNISIDAMLVMDIHSHLSKTEVIGLLGGHYKRGIGVLEVMRAEPCDSLSTGMQCEMDPVSQTEAKERIATQGLQVVGWYHSHPTFEPNPSVRDIETQQNFQAWFSAGKNPFIGIIVNPYSGAYNKLTSTVRSLVISEHTTSALPYNIGQPFMFNHSLVHTTQSFHTLTETISTLVKNCHKSKNRVEMLLAIKGHVSKTCLDKLCASVRSHFEDTESFNGSEEFINSLKYLIEEQYNIPT